jgi:hypothetical protein
MNDTGSNIQTIFPTDLAALQYDPFTYLGDLGIFTIGTANGDAFRNRVMIEMQIVKADGTAITPWFREVAVVTPLQPGLQYRLSGNAMRTLLCNCSRKCESLRRREEKWHYNPTSCYVSCLMYGIRALVRHGLRWLMVLLLLL